MPDPPAQYLVNRRYDDFDALGTEARQWNLDLRQLDAGPFQGHMLQFGVGAVHVSDARFGRTLTQQGDPPPGLRTVVVPGGPDVAFEWRGARIDANSLMVFPRKGELHAISNDKFHVYSCSFPEALLAEVTGSTGRPGSDALGRRGEVVQCDSRHMARIRGILQGLSTQLQQDTSLLSTPDVNETLRWDLPQSILRAAAEADDTRKPTAPAANRARALRLAEDYVEQRADEPVTVREVCQAVRVSLRTLQLAFAERYGITPKSYIRAVRLNRARQGLRQADPAAQTVADVANRCGFWHMGQFAADYRRQFGELPSQSLRSGGGGVATA